MSIHKQVVEDWKTALREKKDSKNALSMIISEFKNKAINDPKSQNESSSERTIKDEAAINVLQKMAKQRKESIDSFKAAGRDELVQRETLELLVIEAYLPKPLSHEEITKLVLDCISEVNPQGMKDMGKVMGLAINRAQGRADGKILQGIIVAKLKNLE